MAAQLLDQGQIRRALGPAARQQQRRCDRDDDSRDLRDQAIANGQNRISFKGLTDRHPMDDRAHDQTHDKVQ